MSPQLDPRFTGSIAYCTSTTYCQWQACGFC